MATAQITISEGVIAQVTVVQDIIELTGIPIPLQGVDSANNISLDTNSFNNNLDNSVTDVQKLAEAIDNMNLSQSIVDGGTY
jgi:hypothetical protein